MNGWNIGFRSDVAQSVYDAVEKGKHLKGFFVAEEKLNDLKNALESALFDCEWWGDKCEQEANHYAYMQKQLQENPQDFSDEHAREVTRKSPQVLYAYADRLKQGADDLRASVHSVEEILKYLQNAKECAQEDSKKVLAKITHAVDLMDTYLRVRF